MPIYEYSCRKCGAHIEVMQKVSDKPLTRHEKCGGKLEKEWSRTGFQFKGTGWYVTDYAGKKAEAKTEAKDGAAASPPKSEAKSEAKETGGEKSKAEKTKAEKAKPSSAGAASSEG